MAILSRFLPVVALLLAFQPGHTQPLQIQPLTGDYFIYTTWQDPGSGTPFPANGMYVLTDSGAVLVDPPWDRSQTLPLVDSIKRRHGKKVVASISTHFHNDRTAGLDVLSAHGVRTISSAQTRRLCQAHGEQMARYTFRRDTLLHLGNHTLRVFYPGPGHAPDNVVVWAAGEGILFGGCLLKSTEAATLGNLSDADIRQWPATLKALQREYPKPRYVIPGHQSWSDSRSIEHTLKLLKKYKP